MRSLRTAWRASGVFRIRHADVLVGAGAFVIVAPSAVRGTLANSKISVGLIAAGIQKIKAEEPHEYQDFEKLLASDVDWLQTCDRGGAAALYAKRGATWKKDIGV